MRGGNIKDGVAIQLSGGLVVFVVDRNRFQVFGFEHLVTIQAANVVDPVSSRHNFGSRMLAGLHRWRYLFPYSKHANKVVKPPKVLGPSRYLKPTAV